MFRPLAERFDSSFFRSIPKTPGVYLMSDADDRLLYVGKSINLRQRVSGYRYLKPEKHSRKLIRLIHEIRKISWEICESDQAAQLRENFLLRTHRPRFNRMNTYPQAYFFIALRPLENGFSLSLTRNPDPEDKVFGAFKVSAMYSFAALLRWIWIILEQPNGVEQFPAGMFGHRIREFSFSDFSLLGEVTSLLEGKSDSLLRREINSTFTQSTFGQSLIESDRELLTQFFQKGCKRNLDLRTRFQISAATIGPEELDDLIVLA